MILSEFMNRHPRVVKALREGTEGYLDMGFMKAGPGTVCLYVDYVDGTSEVVARCTSRDALEAVKRLMNV